MVFRPTFSFAFCDLEVPGGPARRGPIFEYAPMCRCINIGSKRSLPRYEQFMTAPSNSLRFLASRSPRARITQTAGSSTGGRHFRGKLAVSTVFFPTLVLSLRKGVVSEAAAYLYARLLFYPPGVFTGRKESECLANNSMTLSSVTGAANLC